ncbi:MAG: HNH endonuclease [Pseudonocardia sp.]|nr:HNH endonuclease [Pseudonocardia sp.]
MGVVGAQALTSNPNWKGGRVVASNGYVLVKAHGHHRADARGYVYEHVLVAEQTIGRPLRPGEQVHHRNHIKTDNRPENLEVKASHAHHALEHRKRTDLRMPDESNPTVTCECGCGTAFPRYDATNRPRRFVSGHNLRSITNG